MSEYYNRVCLIPETIELKRECWDKDDNRFDKYYTFKLKSCKVKGVFLEVSFEWA